MEKHSKDRDVAKYFLPLSQREWSEEKSATEIKQAFKDQSVLRNIRCQQSAPSSFRKKSFL